MEEDEAAEEDDDDEEEEEDEKGGYWFAAPSSCASPAPAADDDPTATAESPESRVRVVGLMRRGLLAGPFEPAIMRDDTRLSPTKPTAVAHRARSSISISPRWSRSRNSVAAWVPCGGVGGVACQGWPRMCWWRSASAGVSIPAGGRKAMAWSSSSSSSSRAGSGEAAAGVPGVAGAGVGLPDPSSPSTTYHSSEPSEAAAPLAVAGSIVEVTEGAGGLWNAASRDAKPVVTGGDAERGSKSPAWRDTGTPAPLPRRGPPDGAGVAGLWKPGNMATPCRPAAAARSIQGSPEPPLAWGGAEGAAPPREERTRRR
mmetsp:Transcript_13597/g.39610  ORF Transcript_13597/g.39610 Transcript_13597/m.39610 type:complete len:314 (-) Transcript_13597:1804-2745(-)